MTLATAGANLWRRFFAALDFRVRRVMASTPASRGQDLNVVHDDAHHRKKVP